MRSIGTLAARFRRAWQVGGMGHALRLATRGIARRAGVASADDGVVGYEPLATPITAPSIEIGTATLRVLYALEFFPHVSESYIATEIAWMRRQGVHVEAWSERDPPVPDVTDVAVHRGELATAIAASRPHLVHGHHLEQALGYAPIVAAAHLPMTVRAHGFALDDARLHAIRDQPALAAVFHFPHMMGRAADGSDAKVRPMTACFDPALCHPGGEKDPRLVVRTGLASPTKDLAMFIRLAARFPRHRFVLIPCWSYGMPRHLDELLDLNRSLGSPTEIRPNLRHAQVVRLVQDAGIYLHTHALADDYGMPISIAEAMATGCHVIARRGPSTAAYLGDVGRLYDDEHEAAALLGETEHWDAARWRRARFDAIERAYGAFAAPVVLPPLLDTWRAVTGRSVADGAHSSP